MERLAKCISPLHRGDRLAVRFEIFDVEFNRLADHGNCLLDGIAHAGDAEAGAFHPIGDIFIGLGTVNDNIAYRGAPSHFSCNTHTIPVLRKFATKKRGGWRIADGSLPTAA